jgi:nicotinate phosphoribosyltransferase
MRATDFVEHLRMSADGFSPPVRSLMDVDFYKFTMGQLIYRHFRGVEVTFSLIVRDPDISIASVVPEALLRKYLDHVRELGFTRTDLYYLRGMDLYGLHMFSEDYIDFLRTFRLPPYKLVKQGDAYVLTFTGEWVEVSMWETIALAIISELFYRQVMRDVPTHVLENIYRRAQVRLFDKFELLKGRPSIQFADFGQRRRHSFLWQEWAIGLCRDMMGKQFTGTSNTWMAFHHDLIPIGTNAHEVPMVLTALADSSVEMKYAQYRVLELWQKMYGQGLRIFLPDTYGSEQFFATAPEWLKDWRGQRQDSGLPVIEGERYMAWLRRCGVDPSERITIFSDGLDVDSMCSIDDHFVSAHPHPFGWGSLLTNDFRDCHPESPQLKPFSMVCKVVRANDRPCVKLSNNTSKATGPAQEIARYAEIFGTGGRVSQSVYV